MKKERRQNNHLTFIKVSGGIQANNSFLLIKVQLNNAFPHPFPLLAVRRLAEEGAFPLGAGTFWARVPHTCQGLLTHGYGVESVGRAGNHVSTMPLGTGFLGML